MQPSAPQQPEPAPPSHSTRAAKFICPYCGGVTHMAARCEQCRGPLDPLSRQATQSTMGPWFIRDEANPFRPGCSYETITTLAARAKIGPDTIVRGPTTRQFWCAAKRARGIAHLVGLCHDCGSRAEPSDSRCPACGCDFVIETDRQFLGLDPRSGTANHAETPSTHPSGSALTFVPPRRRPAGESYRWLATSMAILLLAVLALGYISLRAYFTPESSTPVTPGPDLDPVDARAPAQTAPPAAAPQIQATTQPKQPAPQPPARTPELERAEQLLAEGTPEGLSQVIALASAPPNDSAPVWIALKDAAQRRLLYLQLRKIR